MEALTIKKPRLKLGIPTQITDSIFIPTVKIMDAKGVLEHMKQYYTKFAHSMYAQGSAPKELSEADLQSIEVALNRIFDGENQGAWEELDADCGLTILRDDNVAEEVRDYFEDRDTESYLWFSKAIYLKAFKNEPQELLEAIKNCKGHLEIEKYLEALFEKNEAREEILCKAILEEYIKVTPNKDLAANDCFYSDGITDIFKARGYTYYFNFRRY